MNFFAMVSRISGIQLKESEIPITIGIRDSRSMTKNPESSTLRLFWIPFRGRNNGLVFYCQFVCRALPEGRYVTRINAVSWHITRQTFASLVYLSDYVHTYCVPIATLN